MQLATFLLTLEDYMLPCLNKKLFGIDCPGCGLQRSIVLFFKGDFSAAFDMYPAIFTLIPLVMFAFASQFIRFRFDTHIKMALGILSGSIIIVNYIFKMTHLTH
ncbi:hypothetical protein B4Q04_19815 [Zobellia sp. OII3]|uniref:DUF2752 domain-containing protein n=1 Tax=Zobellia sp. OII3 TaxID=2034520 RepID=UPI000B5317F1|nr:DUF2752 domain-containing protein [Zobellia sp. OII3]OWW23580.1 hypothetical protein B4Q04_19815 [Zobellia sp. OII3]